MSTKSKTILQVAAGILLLAVIGAGLKIILNKNAEVNQLNARNAGLSNTLQQRDSLVSELADAFDEIENNLTFVREKRGQLSIAPAEAKKSRNETIVEDVRLMNDMLTESSKKIEELEKKLKSSGIEIKSFRNKIAALSKSIEEQQNNITTLTAELEQRNLKIADMDQQITVMKEDMVVMQEEISSKADTISMKSQVIESRENELNKAFFVSGTYRELLDKGIIEREGGFLGLGKGKDLKDDLNETWLLPLDQRLVQSLPIHAKKAHLITEHPGGSYQLVYENDQVAFIQIEDPSAFWKLSRYLVVETRN